LDREDDSDHSEKLVDVIDYPGQVSRNRAYAYKLKVKLPRSRRAKQIKGTAKPRASFKQLDRRLPFTTSAQKCTRPFGHTKDLLVSVSKSLRQSRENSLRFRQLLVGTIFSNIYEIPAGLRLYAKTDLKGNLIIDRRIPYKLLQSVVNMIIYCESTFLANNFGRMSSPIWEINRQVTISSRQTPVKSKPTSTGVIPFLFNEEKP
jgi:hypothetical protein